MAQGRSYGDYLREARERQGIDLVTMARRLHIRPDIVGTIESADFSKMPAHGYTKNMVRAYARQVGLDEARIAEMYAAQRERFDGVSYASSRSSYPGGARSRSSSTVRGSRDTRSSRFSEPIGNAPSTRLSSASLSSPVNESSQSRRRETQAKRENVSERMRASRQDNGHRSRFTDLASSFSSGTQRTPRTTKVQTSFTQGGAYSASSRPTNRGASLAGGASRLLDMLNMRVILIIIGAALLIVLAVVLLNGGKQSTEEVPDIPISGLTDTSATDPNAMPAPIVAAPTSATFTFSVADGGKSWINIYENGNSAPVFSEVAEGPLTKDFEVTGTLTFETANITPVTIMVDGEEVQPTVSSKTSMYVYTVDFPAILAQWKEAHAVDDGQTDGGNAAQTSNASNTTTATNTAS